MPQLDTQPAAETEDTQTTKKPYQTPALRRYGNASELTQTNVPAQGSPTDGGTSPNIYAS